MLEEFLPHARAPVFGLLEFGHPVVDGGVEFGEGFFLLEHGLVAETRDAGRSQVRADAVVEVAAARAETAVGFAQVFAAFVEAAEFLCGC